MTRLSAPLEYRERWLGNVFSQPQLGAALSIENVLALRWLPGQHHLSASHVHFADLEPDAHLSLQIMCLASTKTISLQISA